VSDKELYIGGGVMQTGLFLKMAIGGGLSLIRFARQVCPWGQTCLHEVALGTDLLA